MGHIISDGMNTKRMVVTLLVLIVLVMVTISVAGAILIGCAPLLGMAAYQASRGEGTRSPVRWLLLGVESVAVALLVIWAFLNVPLGLIWYVGD